MTPTITLSQPLTVAAQPFDFSFDVSTTALVIIDMQRDFIEPGGFGESLGNDVSLLSAIVPACQRVLVAWRQAGEWWCIPGRPNEADLSDCPPAKRDRGNPSLRIGDVGPMGRILVKGEPGNQIIAKLAPLPGEIIIDKPGKGAFYATGLHATLQSSTITHLIFMGVTTRCVFKPACEKPMTAVMTACCWWTAPRVISQSSKPPPSP